MELDARTKRFTIFAAVFILSTVIYITCYTPVSVFRLGEAVARIQVPQDIPTSTSTPTPAKRDEGEKVEKRTIRQEYLKAAFETSEKLYQSFVEKRRELVGGDPANVEPWESGRILYLWDYFLPTFSCPYSTQRIGTFGDGGKWTCGFELFDKDASKGKTSKSRPCIVYSFGVAWESSFEAEFLKRTDCEIFAYDASVNRPGPQVAANEPRLHFHKINVDGNNTLAKMMKKNNHTWIDFLKMDVEGAEFSVLAQILDDFKILPFGHLNVEVHTYQQGNLFPTVYKLWERLEEKGLRPFKNEMNHFMTVNLKQRPILAEYSFINIFGQSRLLLLISNT